MTIGPLKLYFLILVVVVAAVVVAVGFTLTLIQGHRIANSKGFKPIISQSFER